MPVTYYAHLEPYEERYTWQLRDWMLSAADTRKHRVRLIEPDARLATTGGAIKTGRVLDAHRRVAWATSQIGQIATLHSNGEIGPDDAILFADMFHPGVEGLFYIFDQTAWPRIYMYCWAQTFDHDDFTVPMIRWMRAYETMCANAPVTIFCAAYDLAERILTCIPTADVQVVGLPFSSKEVLERARGHPGFPLRKDGEPIEIIYTSRWDTEKDPLLFLGAARLMSRREGYRFVVTTSAPKMRSNDPLLLEELRQAVDAGDVVLYEGLSKEEYYARLQRATLHVNTAKQDWVSYGILEASALGVPSIAPSRKAMPETFHADRRHLYTPGNLAALVDAIHRAVANGDLTMRPHCVHDLAIDRMLERIERDRP